MKKKWLFIVSLGMIILNLLLVLKMKEMKSIYFKLSKQSEMEVLQGQKTIKTLISSSLQQQTYENFEISDLQLEQSSDLFFPLSYLIKDKSILFYRFKEFHCGMCINNFLELLKIHQDDFPIENMVILSGYSTIRPFKAFINENNLNIPVFNIPEIIDLPLDTLDSPYFFILDKNLEMKNIFIPVKRMSPYTLEYIKLMNLKYWKK